MKAVASMVRSYHRWELNRESTSERSGNRLRQRLSRRLRVSEFHVPIQLQILSRASLAQNLPGLYDLKCCIRNVLELIEIVVAPARRRFAAFTLKIPIRSVVRDEHAVRFHRNGDDVRLAGDAGDVVRCLQANPQPHRWKRLVAAVACEVC